MKVLKRILIVLICLIIVGFLAYKILYPYVAPMVFDYIVDHNIDAFIKLEQSLSDSLLTEDLSGEEGEIPATDSETDEGETSPVHPDKPDGVTDSGEKIPSGADSESTDSSKKPDGDSGSSADKPESGDESTSSDKGNTEPNKPNTDIQSVKTTMGVFSGAHLARALKNMSPADKTRIISLCQSAVSASDILKVSKMMMQDGLTKDQQKYIENYLRDNLSVPAKREILEILQKY